MADKPRSFDRKTVLARAAQQREAGRLAEAKRLCNLALRNFPGDALALTQLALVEDALGNKSNAITLAKQAITKAPAAPAFYYMNYALVLDHSARWEDAAAAYAEALRRDPNNIDTFRAVVRSLCELCRSSEKWDGPAEQAKLDPPDHITDDRSISVVMCSIDEQKKERARKHYESLLAGRRYELVIIPDAKSLCEGYNRGFARSQGDVIIFSHDDFEVLSPRFADRLLRRLRACDLVGIAGTSKIARFAWTFAGWPHTRGYVVHPLPEGYRIECFGASQPTANVQAFDGVLFAAKREVCEQISFDEATFDGFHFYDLDFTFRVFRAGFRTAICPDILLLHASRGVRDEKWNYYLAKFQEKHGQHVSQVTAPETRGWAWVDFANLDQLLTFHARIVRAIESPIA